MGPWGQSIQSFRSPLLNPGLSWDGGHQGVAASSWRPSSPVSWETAGLKGGLLQRPRGVAAGGWRARTQGRPRTAAGAPGDQQPCEGGPSTG